VIAGAASHGQVRIGQILLTLLLLVAFLAAAALAIYPLARRFKGLVARHARTPDTDLTALLLVTLLCAAATEWMGVHAVFGAFVAGALFRQIPELAPATVHRLESFVFAVLAPIFFGTVGLKVDLWALTDLGALLLVLGIACAGKLVGCTLGSLWGGLRFWEGLSIAVAMNARGAMELIVATVGLSLGILNREMFSIIVVVAVVTSFMAPVGLRLTMRKVRMTEEEEQRIHGASGRTFFDPARVRILLATRGGQNAAGALALATGLAARSAHKVDVLSLEAPRSLPQRILRLFRPGAADEAEEQARAALEDRLRGAAVATVARKRADVANAIVEQARRGYDLVLLGASNRGQIGGAVLEEVVRRAPCHVAAIRAAGGEPQFRRLLVPFDGGLFSRLALEFASQLAELSDATLTVAVIRDPHAAGALADASSAGTAERDLSQLTPLFGPSARRPQVIEVAYDPEATVLVAEASSGKYDLVVLGAEHRALQHRLFFGIDKERLLQEAPIGVAVLVPHLPSLRQEG
jgi:nucleotide-binding universal stress UspA family protein